MKHFYIIGCSDYSIGDSTVVKLGFSALPCARLSYLQTGNPAELIIMDAAPIKDAKIFEKFVHRAFGENRVRGEWYKLTLKELQLLYANVENARIECDCKACSGYYVDKYLDKLKTRTFVG